jgi:hypothetical protein
MELYFSRLKMSFLIVNQRLAVSTSFHLKAKDSKCDLFSCRRSWLMFNLNDKRFHTSTDVHWMHLPQPSDP